MNFFKIYITVTGRSVRVTGRCQKNDSMVRCGSLLLFVNTSVLQTSDRPSDPPPSWFSKFIYQSIPHHSLIIWSRKFFPAAPHSRPSALQNLKIFWKNKYALQQSEFKKFFQFLSRFWRYEPRLKAFSCGIVKSLLRRCRLLKISRDAEKLMV